MAKATHYALSVMCQDKVGLVARLTHSVSTLGGNIEDLHQGVLQGYFVFMLMVTFPEEVTEKQVRAAIEGAGKSGEFTVSVLPRKDYSIAPAATGSSFILAINGSDAPGILKRVTAYLADHGINIENLSSEVRNGKALITARLTIPQSVDVRSARLDLAEILKPDPLTLSLIHEDIFAATSRIDMPKRTV